MCALSISIQTPFYPLEAEEKGATPSQYGFVFGVFSLALFIFSPVAGLLMSKFDATKIILCGLLTIGSTNIFFGFLDKISVSYLFIGMSIIIRIFEGAGYALVRNTSIAVIICEFSSNIEMALAVVNLFFFAGFLIGPVAGGTLFELGGFKLPFIFIGVLLLSTAFVVFFLPKSLPKQENISVKQITMVLRLPCVILGVLTVFGSTMKGGFMISTIEPHLQKIDFSPFEVGLMILCSALANGITSIVCSKLCVKYNCGLLIICFSSFIFICSLPLLGPSLCIQIDLNIYTIVLSMILSGIGFGGEQLAGFSIINKGAQIAGLPKNLHTYGLVSTIFTSSIFLGNSIGPILGGWLYEVYGYPTWSHLLILYSAIICLVTIICIYLWRKNPEFHQCRKPLSSSENSSRSSRYNTID